MNKSHFNIYRERARDRLSDSLPESECVYMCIGTDSVVSDSLGPRVGSLLLERMKSAVFVYGLLGRNITAVNLMSAYNLIKILHPNKKILVVDAAVGDENEIGTVVFDKAPLLPGAATNKNLPELGDYSIIGIVAKRGLEDFYQSTAEKQALVGDMAEVICGAIVNSHEKQLENTKLSSGQRFLI